MEIKKVKYVKDYIIEISWENGDNKLYDFKNWLFSDINPMYHKFRKKDNFKKVKPYGFMVVFGNEEMEFPDRHLKYFEIKSKKISPRISVGNKKMQLSK
jgi:hypothetical protein